MSTSSLGRLIDGLRESWMRDALCVEHPYVDFFPEEGPGTEAKAVCARCLVREECLDYALRCGPDTAGIWGGTTHRQRRRMRRAVA